MTNYSFTLSLLFLLGCIGLALKPSPIYGGLVLVFSGCLCCLTVLDFGGSFLGLAVLLIYLGGMMVVFGYTTAMASEEYPETWSSNWVIFMTFMFGAFVEMVLIYIVENYFMVGLGLEVPEVENWVPQEVDEAEVVEEEGVGVGAIYNTAVWLLVVAGWSLFVGVVVIVEMTYMG
uniref:NADH-ubiquinone oxidoreductase chain 6 n=1 Tax=Gerbilliscus leucogaster TaxID=410302 RepID=A0A4D6DI72_9RODE|nr:NADH dehydrogenase subunit 6 [Gerbilliscus leucogaster]QBZ37948.1 NADH dehydrogenase subunit 6 [Gerbilliscus leucogaster]